MRKLIVLVFLACVLLSSASSVHARRYYDSSIGRWLIPDPALQEKEPQWLAKNGYYTVSPYVYCFNNPMIFVDPAGDTISVSDDLSQTQEWQDWINSDAGKQFYATFGAGGEWGDINVNFGFPKVLFGTVEASNKFLQSFGIGLSAFTGNTKLLEDGKTVKAVEKGFESAPGYMPKEDADYSFDVTLNPLSDNFSKNYGTITHETDHVIYMTDKILNRTPIMNAVYQHKILGMQGKAGTQYYLLPQKK